MIYGIHDQQLYLSTTFPLIAIFLLLCSANDSNQCNQRYFRTLSVGYRDLDLDLPNAWL